MPPDRTVPVHSEPDGTIGCQICGVVLDSPMIAALTRTAPGRPFDAWCRTCFKNLVSLAKAAGDAVEAIEIIF